MTRYERNFAQVVLIGVILGLTVSVEAQFYQYTDKNGSVVFTDAPPSGSDAKETRMKEGGVYFGNSRYEPDHAAGNKKGLSPAAAQENKRKADYGSITVIMYRTSWCGYCKKAAEYVRSLGANLVEYDIEAQPEKEKEMKEKSGGSKSVPFIDIGGTMIRGYNPNAIKAAIEKVASRW